MSVKVSITVTDGPDSGKNFEFTEGSVTLGRGKADFVLQDKKTSGLHCKFIIEGHDLFIEDLHSTNGTFIGGRRLSQKHLLQNLDEVTVGLSKLSIAIIEQISEFKAKNQPTVNDLISDDDESLEVLTPFEDEISVDESSEPSSDAKPELDQTPAPISKVAEDIPLPSSDAVYRETGIRRIEDLIQDEMEAFSKWDHPSISEGGTNTGSGRVGIPKIKVILTLRRSPESGTNAVCTKAVTTLGRKDVDIRVNDLDCSRKHSAIEIVAGEKAFVRDLASTNGTYINGKRIAYQELKNGDLLQLGQTIYEITIERAS